MKFSKKPEYLIIHCSDSMFGNANMIRTWHKNRGWDDIGYHFVILNGQITSRIYLEALDGSISLGRTLNVMGAHARGYNDKSLGICMIGKLDFSDKQFNALSELIISLMDFYRIPVENVLGHYESKQANSKTCPNFNMALFRQKLILS